MEGSEGGTVDGKLDKGGDTSSMATETNGDSVFHAVSPSVDLMMSNLKCPLTPVNLPLLKQHKSSQAVPLDHETHKTIIHIQQ